MGYQADPGGVFESDTHRRTLGHLPLPSDDATGVDGLVVRMRPDAFTDLDESSAGEVLADLEADGYAAQSAAGWKQTKKGYEALTPPAPSEEN